MLGAAVAIGCVGVIGWVLWLHARAAPRRWRAKRDTDPTLGRIVAVVVIVAIALAAAAYLDGAPTWRCASVPIGFAIGAAAAASGLIGYEGAWLERGAARRERMARHDAPSSTLIGRAVATVAGLGLLVAAIIVAAVGR